MARAHGAGSPGPMELDEHRSVGTRQTGRSKRAGTAGIVITTRKGSQVKVGKKDLEELKKKVALGNRIMFYQGLADYR